MRRILVSEARNDFSNLLNQVAFKNKSVLIRRNKRDMAALVPLENIRKYLLEIEKALDFEALHRSLRRGGRTSLKKALEKSGIDADSKR